MVDVKIHCKVLSLFKNNIMKELLYFMTITSLLMISLTNCNQKEVMIEEETNAISVCMKEEQKELPAIPASDCNLNDLISEGTISNSVEEPIRTHKYLNLKPSSKPLDKILSQYIFQEDGDYQKFYLLEKKAHFSSIIYRYDKDNYSTVHLTTINNNTCDLIDNVLLEERDVFQGESVGITSIQLDNANFISTFYEEDIDYSNLDAWNNDNHAVKYEIDSTGIILEEYTGDNFLIDTLEL